VARKRKAAATDLERFVGAEGRADLVKEVRQRIDAEGITYIYYQFPSVTGRIMGKGVPAQHWESIAEKGFQLDSKVVRLDAPIREVGNYDVRIHLHSDVEVFLPVKVRAEGFETWEPGQPLKKKVGGGDVASG